MKKNWKEPELEVLDFIATEEGGSMFDPPDGDSYWVPGYEITPVGPGDDS